MQFVHIRALQGLTSFFSSEQNITISNICHHLAQYERLQSCSVTDEACRRNCTNSSVLNAFITYLEKNEELSQSEKCAAILEALCVVIQHGCLQTPLEDCEGAYSVLLDDMFSHSSIASPEALSPSRTALILHAFESDTTCKVYSTKISKYLDSEYSKLTNIGEHAHLSSLVQYWIAYIRSIDLIPNCEGCCQNSCRLVSCASSELFKRYVSELIETDMILLDCFDNLSSGCLEPKELKNLCKLFVTWSNMTQQLQRRNSSYSQTSIQDAPDTCDVSSAAELTPISSENFPSSGDSLYAGPCGGRSGSDVGSSRKLRSAMKNPTLDQSNSSSRRVSTSVSPEQFDLLRKFLTGRSYPSLLPVLLRSVEQLVQSVRLSTEPTHVDFPTTIDHKVSSDSLPTSLIGLLVQNPILATSVHGPLFNTMGMTIVGSAADEDFPSSWDQQFHSSSTAQSSMNSWMGIAGTGCGLPVPALLVSRSVLEFQSLVTYALVPGLLSLMKSDIGCAITYTASPDRPPVLEVGACADASATHTTPFQQRNESVDYKNDMETSQSFQSLVFSILRVLVNFLIGVDDSTDAESPDASSSISQQLGEILLQADENEGGVERLSGCIGDLLLLRSVCNLLATTFSGDYAISADLVVGLSSGFQSTQDLSTYLRDVVKQYDSSIRLLSEHLVDLCLIRSETLIVDHLIQQPSAHDDEGTSVVYNYLLNLWTAVASSCPAGLARQILAHVSAQFFTSCALLVTSEQYSARTSLICFERQLRSLLRIAHFCLFLSSEVVPEVLGVGPLSADISLLHSAATTLAQTLVCRCMPRQIWNKIHDGGFYQSPDLKENDSFRFCISNWLCFTDPVLFSEAPSSTLFNQREQIDLQIMFELFAVGRHFDPIKLVSLMIYDEGRICTELLSSVHLTSPNHTGLQLRLFRAVFHVFSLIPGQEMFYSKLLSQMFKRSNDFTIQADSSDQDPFPKWPLWFHAVVSLIDEALCSLWNSFKLLARQHIVLDETFASKKLDVHHSPCQVLSHHVPQQRGFWLEMFPDGQLPCGCSFPQPPQLGRHMLDGQDSKIGTEASTVLDYEQYYTNGGGLVLAWKRLACDLIRSVVLILPFGIQLALNLIEEATPVDQIRGGHIGIHIILSNLLRRIEKEHIGCEVENLRLRVFWEQLCCVLESASDPDINGCKQRMVNCLTELCSHNTDSSQETKHGFMAQRLQISQYVDMIQQKALPELYFLHAIFKRNVKWLRGVIYGHHCSSALSEAPDEETISLDLTSEAEDQYSNFFNFSGLPELDWDKLALVNIGLTADAVSDLTESTSPAFHEAQTVAS